MGFPVLSTIFLAPALAAFLLCFISKDAQKAIRLVAGSVMLATLLLTMLVYFSYDTASGGMQFTESIPWITDLGVSYAVGVDGISLPLLFLAEVIGTSAVFSSWNVAERPKEFFILVLILLSGVVGTFLAIDLFIFLLCYELVVIPIYILILVWGSTRRVTKEYSAMKLTLYLLMGSAFMLVGVVMIYLAAFPAPYRTFDMAAISLAAEVFPSWLQILVFFLFILAFGSLLTMFPLYCWSPDGHAAAPTAVSMIHAGLLKKIGVYGLIRLGILMLPLGAKFWSPMLALFAMLNIVYAAYVAISQRDLKYIIGYSSVSHMGYILFGLAALNATSIKGAIADMVAHGLMIALFFSMIGYVYEKTHLRTLDDLRGLAHQMPRIGIGFMIAAMSSVGLPGLISFVPEFTIFVSTLPVHPFLAVFAVSGIVFTAVYTLRLVAKVLFGPRDVKFDKYPDARYAEVLPIVFLGLSIIGFGLMPQLLMGVVDAGIAPWDDLLQQVAQAPDMFGGAGR